MLQGHSIKVPGVRVAGFHKAWVWAALLLLVSGAVFLHGYLLENPLTCASLLLLPLVSKINTGRHSSRFLYASIICSAGAILIPLTVLGYLAWLCGIFLVIEARFGRLNYPALFLALIASPLSSYALSIFEFGIRLKLTSFAANLLSLISSATAEGNIIVFNGEEFSVDPACAGLKFTIAGIIIGILFLSRFERQRSRAFSFLTITSFLGIAFLLNVLGNLFRICMLVAWRVHHTETAHDIIGILCLAVYLALPLYFIAKLFARKAKVPTAPSKVHAANPYLKNGSTLLILCISGLMIFMTVRGRDTLHPAPVTELSGIGYTCSIMYNETLKLENTDALIYLKKIYGFYGAEHNPMLCWIGSGYTFHKIVENKAGARYEGILVKGADTLSTTWWYDNGSHRTTSQWDWRWRMFRGEPAFYIVNVSAADKHKLAAEILRFKNRGILGKILEKPATQPGQKIKSGNSIDKKQKTALEKMYSTNSNLYE